MISEEFAKQLVPDKIIQALAQWDPRGPNDPNRRVTRALPTVLDARLEYALNAALDIASSAWALMPSVPVAPPTPTAAAAAAAAAAGGGGGGSASAQEGGRCTPVKATPAPALAAASAGPDAEGGAAAALPLCAADPTTPESTRANIRLLVALLQVRPVIPNSLFAIIFQAIVTIGKVSPPDVLLTEHGPLLFSLLELSPYVPTSIANVARVTARNVARRVPASMFALASYDRSLLSWVVNNIDSLSRVPQTSPDATTRFHSDRKVAMMLVDKMCRVPEGLPAAAGTVGGGAAAAGTRSSGGGGGMASSSAAAAAAAYSPVGLDLVEAVRGILGELDTTEKQIGEAFIGRVLRFNAGQANDQQQAAAAAKWLPGTGDTLGSPLPEPPTRGAVSRDRLRELLLHDSSSSRSPPSGDRPADGSDEAGGPGVGGKATDVGEKAAWLQALPLDAVLAFLEEQELVYRQEMEAYRTALDAERKRLAVLETRHRFVKDEGEEIDQQARSQSRAAIQFLTPRASGGELHGTGAAAKQQQFLHRPNATVSPAALSPENQRSSKMVVDLLVRQCAAQESLTSDVAAAPPAAVASKQQQQQQQHVMPTVQRLDLAKINRPTGTGGRR